LSQAVLFLHRPQAHEYSRGRQHAEEVSVYGKCIVVQYWRRAGIGWVISIGEASERMDQLGERAKMSFGQPERSAEMLQGHSLVSLAASTATKRDLRIIDSPSASSTASCYYSTPSPPLHSPLCLYAGSHYRRPRLMGPLQLHTHF